MISACRLARRPSPYSCLRRAFYATTSARVLKEGWNAVIGIEVHAQINSKTKLFSDMITSYEAPPNSKTSVIDLAFPGVQPRLNEACVELALRTALAVKSKVQLRSSFDRKQYFYPDLPQGYQITQYREPIALGGMIELSEMDGVAQPLTVRIQQIQLEQDTGKSMHDMRPGWTLLDMNRAGTGLMEIVTMPDIKNSTEAGAFVKKLQAILQCVGSSRASMNEGSMRCDVNVSVHRDGENSGTRCEIKNLNSVKFLSMAIDAEIERQIALIENGGVVTPETRGYDVAAKKTFRLRSKETAPDYRYMPEPDLPKLILTQEYIDKVGSNLPELPDAARNRIMKQYNLSLDDANSLLNEAGSLKFFEEVCKGRNSQTVLNWTLNDLFGELAKSDLTFAQCPITVEQMGSLVDLVQDNKITAKIGKNVLRLMLQEEKGAMPKDIVEKKGWGRMEDQGQLQFVCKRLIAKNEKRVELFRKGEMKVFKWFVGQVMRETRGLADPSLVNSALCEALGCKPEDIAHVEERRKTKKSKGPSATTAAVGR